MSNIAVLDIGKTNAKVLLIDGSTGVELAVERSPNRVIDAPPYPHHDVEGLFTFILGALKAIAARHRIDAISITAHGGSAVLVAEDGSLALPMLDYEFSGIDETRAAYDKLRPPFEETGSPPLPGGLNVGAQLFWQQTKFPNDFARAKWIVTYPQYWSMRLTGQASAEPTSLGCHTDVWNPWAGDFSSLVDRMGWRAKFPPVRPAGEVLGPVLPEIAAAAGLIEGTPVTSGIHDSNASLLPYLQGTKQPFSVASTGTWIIAFSMRHGTRWPMSMRWASRPPPRALWAGAAWSSCARGSPLLGRPMISTRFSAPQLWRGLPLCQAAVPTPRLPSAGLGQTNPPPVRGRLQRPFIARS
jgi:sugar (pentulose or hexulose) kinase